MIKTFLGRLAAALLALALATSLALAQFSDQQQYAPTSGGTANAQTIVINNFPAAPPAGVPFRFKPGNNNTTAATLNISGSGVKNVFKPSPAGPVALTGGELLTGQMVEVVYDGTQYVITSSVNSTLSNVFVPPQTYVTPCQITSGSPVTGCTAGQLVPTADVTAATALYLEPVGGGNQVPIWNGSQFIIFTFAETTLTMNAAHLASTIYDVCVFNNAGTVQVATSVAWTTSTAGAGARGSGAGTAQLEQKNGVWTNAVQATVRNGGTTYVVAANQCTIVATILMDGTNGQISFTRSLGISRKWGAWNFYNRLPIVLKVADPTASWTYTTATYRASRAQSTNSLTTLTGLPDESIRIEFDQNVKVISSAVTNTAIGWNSITVPSGKLSSGSASLTPSGGAVIDANMSLIAEWNPATSIGANVATSLEAGNASAPTFFGTVDNMLLIATWRG